jgi:hypothetical protein
MISIPQAAHQRAHDALGQEYWLYALQLGFLEQHLVAAVIRDFLRLDAGAVEDFFVVDGAHLCAEMRVEDKRRRRRLTISFQLNEYQQNRADVVTTQCALPRSQNGTCDTSFFFRRKTGCTFAPHLMG